jgi:hypothetical protein
MPTLVPCLGHTLSGGNPRPGWKESSLQGRPARQSTGDSVCLQPCRAPLSDCCLPGTLSCLCSLVPFGVMPGSAQESTLRGQQAWLSTGDSLCLQPRNAPLSDCCLLMTLSCLRSLVPLVSCQAALQSRRCGDSRLGKAPVIRSAYSPAMRPSATVAFRGLCVACARWSLSAARRRLPTALQAWGGCAPPRAPGGMQVWRTAGPSRHASVSSPSSALAAAVAPGFAEAVGLTNYL